MSREILACHPGLPLQLFPPSMEKCAVFSVAAKKSCKRRPGYEAREMVLFNDLEYMGRSGKAVALLYVKITECSNKGGFYYL